MSKREANRRKLTDSVVRSLPPGEIVWDTFLPAFGIRCGQRARTWIVAVVRPGSKHPVRLKLGRYPALSLADARDRARKLMEGTAPPPLRRFGELAKEFLADGRTRSGRPLRPSSLRTYRVILGDTAKVLHEREVAEIRRGDIAALTRGIARATSPAHAGLTRAVLARFWGWLAENDLAETDPVRGSPAFATTRRERVLSDAEIRALWRCETAGDDVLLIVRLLLWLGCRESEIGSLRWSELQDGLWTLPSARAKNHRQLALPLARQTIDALAAWPRITGRDLVFGVYSRRGFTRWAPAKAKLDASIGFNAPWQWRDIRRTVRTGMAKVGVPSAIVDRCLNHGVPQMASIYDRHHYLDEKAGALQKWADRLDEIVGVG